MNEPTLRVEGLHKRFGELEVLRGVDLAVDDHEVVCLIGASGSGKSTLLRCIDLLEPIDGGRILIEGLDVTARGIDQNAVRSKIGIVFQSFNLFPHMTVRKNVTLAPRKVLGLSDHEATTRADELLSRFGLEAKADEFPDRLSGGQQQRVAIVRALAMQPDILLLDEVTSALDPVLVAEVLDAIRELAAEGMTMAIATHEMGFARDIANRVCFLHQGEILEEGDPERCSARRRTRRPGGSSTGSSRPAACDGANHRRPDRVGRPPPWHVPPFRIVSEFEPAGDQPLAIDQLTAAVTAGDPHTTLLGVTGTGKTFTIAHVIERVQRPTLIMAPNKSLARPARQRVPRFFPDNAVEYFVSYYDYYQPEAYVP